MAPSAIVVVGARHGRNFRNCGPSWRSQYLGSVLCIRCR